MRAPILFTAALALTACGSTVDKSYDSSNASTVDEVTVPNSEAEMGSNAAMATAPIDTDTFLARAGMSDMYEVAAGNIARDKAQAPGLKSFAADMVRAHTATTAALKAAVAKEDVTMTPPAALDARHQVLIDALNAAEPATFDEIYKAQQRDAHAEALALMQGYAKSGDKPAIRAFAADTAPKVQMHIDMLGKLN